MAALRIQIEQFLELAKTNPVLDVRSPSEYKHAHLPGAYSLPLFNDEERKAVGTVYKQESREKAIKLGLDYFGPKMKKIIEEVEAIGNRGSVVNMTMNGSQFEFKDPKTVLVYCWRGGMRSGAISWLLDMYGFKVYTLAGGYKRFRNHILETFRQPFNFKILGGYTGSGKTELLKHLGQQGIPIIDLEEIARHKGSAFGNIGLPPQPGQEMFENLLGMELLSKSEFDDQHGQQSLPIWVEDESQRIGQVNLPGDFWKSMRRSPVYFLEIPFEERLNHIVDEYGKLDRQRVIDAIGRISDKLGGLNARSAIQLFEEGNTLESFRILLKYYDKYYFKALHNREVVNSLLHSIKCNTVTIENANRLPVQHRFQHEKP
jgi:tRNA 2-selenouridine synthase